MLVKRLKDASERRKYLDKRDKEYFIIEATIARMLT